MAVPVLKSKFVGCLLGLALGDALGAPFEGSFHVKPEEVYERVSSMALLRYTDDAHMASGLSESLVACKGFNGEDMAKRFVSNYSREPWRGYGPGAPRVFARIKEGVPWYKAAEEIYPGGSFGNGSAMRAAPVGLFFCHDLEMVTEVSRLQSRITHTHPLGQEGAVLQALAVAVAAANTTGPAPGEMIGQLEYYALEDAYRHKLARIRKLLETNDSKLIAAELGNSIEAVHSVPAAICCALRHPRSFENAVFEAVSLGGDTDTIASMTGAISGAWLGEEAIPNYLASRLENHRLFINLAEDLYRASNHV